jgi:pimeloyl-ACP methyl ester carboxylesterase
MRFQHLAMVPFWHGDPGLPPTPAGERRHRRGAASAGLEQVRIGRSRLVAEFYSPQQPRGAVLMLRANPSAPRPRERFLADVLNTYRLATLAMDFASEDMRQGASSCTEIGAVCERAEQALGWLARHGEPAHARVGLLGAGPAAAAVLHLAARWPGQIGAAVLCGGSTDLAAGCLERVHAPVLLIVGAKDGETLRGNRETLAALPGEKRLEVIPGAAHGFEEPGTLAAAAHLAGAWLAGHLEPAGRHW